MYTANVFKLMITK